jgi:sporulation protein YlmC with PRC-barrel domain
MRQRTRRVERLLGQPVFDPAGKKVGRLEEIRAERHQGALEVREYLLGPGALIERLGVVSRLLGRKRLVIVARWDQLDITGSSLRLTCGVDELERHRPRHKLL